MTPEPSRTLAVEPADTEAGDRRPRDFAEVADAGDKLAVCHALNHTGTGCEGRHPVGRS
jgi:hypothetical protein